MGAVAPVSVDYDFTAGHTGVAVRAADNELTRGVDVQNIVAVQKSAELLGQRLAGAGNENVPHIAAYGLQHSVVGFLLAQPCGCRIDELVVLGRHNYGVYAQGLSMLAIFHSDLAFGIGAQICHVHTLAADLLESHQQSMAQRESERNIEWSLVCGVAEHHALVAGTLPAHVVTHDTLVDIGALLMDGGEYAAGIAVETQLAAVVADLADYAAGSLLNVDIGIGTHLAGNDNLPGCNKSLACHFRRRVAGEKLIDYGVGNLVGDLIGMAG